MDKITEPLRKRFPIYLFTCLRCVSIWAGLAAVLLFIFLPWANWPFALSWAYIQHMDWIIERNRKQKGRQFVATIDKDNRMTFPATEFMPTELKFLSAHIDSELHKSVETKGSA